MQDSGRTDGQTAMFDDWGWWLFVLILAGAMAFVASHFVGLLVVGVFGYYATRPIRDRVGGVVESNRLAAVVTVLAVLLPVLLLVSSLLVRVAQQLAPVLNGDSTLSLVKRVDAIGSLPAPQREQLKTLLRDPGAALGQGGTLQSNAEVGIQVVQGVFGALLLAALAVTLSYVLLAKDNTLSDVFAELVGGRDTTAYAYAAAVDEDLESVFFGNFLFAVIMAVVATGTYWATNLVAPEGLQVPMVLVLGALTGVASLVPVVVGKLVYVPVVGYLTVQSVQSGDGLSFVVLVLVAYLVVLDLVPQALVQPYVSGRQFDMTLLLFAYILGPIVFGWYGFFLLPILFVLALEAVRIVLPELLRGTSPRPAVELDVDSGTNPLGEREDVAGSKPSDVGDDPTAGGGSAHESG